MLRSKKGPFIMKVVYTQKKKVQEQVAARRLWSHQNPPYDT